MNVPIKGFVSISNVTAIRIMEGMIVGVMMRTISGWRKWSKRWIVLGYSTLVIRNSLKTSSL